MQTVWELIALYLTFLNLLITGPNVANPQMWGHILAYVEVLERLIRANHLDDIQQVQRPRVRRARRVWTWPYIARRTEKGHYENLLRELDIECPHLYKAFTRITKRMFNMLVEKVTPLIRKEDTFMRRALSPGIRMAITLRFLATGESYKSIGLAFRVGHATVSKIVPETCKAIITAYAEQWIKTPRTQEEWNRVAEGFERRWNLPHCVGALDGKHIRIRNPLLAGSYYHNYKKFFSVVLMAVVDANYRFIFVDVGAIGSENDSGVFGRTRLARLFDRHRAGLPPPCPLPGDPNGRAIPYFLVGDDCFKMETHLMKPYPKRAMTLDERRFNYRLSRARRCVENAFGILANRFRCMHTVMCMQPDRVDLIVTAACIIHNMLRTDQVAAAEPDREDPVTHDMIDGEWRDAGVNIQGEPIAPPNPFQARPTINALAQREYLKNYLSTGPGALPWQDARL